DEVHTIGLPIPGEAGSTGCGYQEFKFTGLSWDRDKIVLGRIDEVMPHPNADRLVLCRLQDGLQEHVVLTGAPNLLPYRGQGPLPKPLLVAYAREGARIYDGHQEGYVLTTLKRAKIRGVESYSMVCSEKELGISDEHEGIMLINTDAPAGTPLVDLLGDAVFEISILPNMIRNACMLGVARELSAALGKPLHKPHRVVASDGPTIAGQVAIQITDSTLNPRFTLGLIRGAAAQSSPDWVQRRLRLAGMRPINAIVDATNYVMLEVGQPLHAFDYDTLVQRANGQAPTIITRAAQPGEGLTTLDGVERVLEPYTILVTDTAGPLSLAGVMGGLESEVTPQTRNVLLEGANWNLVNVRRTVSGQRLNSEAAYRFARGIHPALAAPAVEYCLDLMAQWCGGQIARGLVDVYPNPLPDPVVALTVADLQRVLGIELSLQTMADLLTPLEFVCSIEGDVLKVKTPAHRLDIGTGLVGKADVIEEIARMHGYDKIPSRRLADSLPVQRGNPTLEREEALRDLLAGLGLQEVVTYRLTSPEREARLLSETGPYVGIQNPIAPDRCVMRRSLLASVLEVLERNARLRERLAFFEIGPVFHPVADQQLPAEPPRLALVLAGRRELATWDQPHAEMMDFFDLKGLVEQMLEGLHLEGAAFEPVADDPRFHPGKCAALIINAVPLGILGELHPALQQKYDLANLPVLAADLDAGALLELVKTCRDTRPVPAFPPVLEDLAVVVAEDLPAERVAEVIRQAGGKLVTAVRLFDIFRGEQLGEGKKSLAYSVTYQSYDSTLTDAQTQPVRARIIRRLEQELGAKLRS
ncbi:MAG TPA: phenylalanine--tRNA ligase subunit beta, partial [Anaerolineaceae bacterium]|nr:phenylalanine--tRNA ligase subunit beta [Anaerolineaceae bacterium]